MPHPHIRILAHRLHHAQTGLRRLDLGNLGSPDARHYGLRSPKGLGPIASASEVLRTLTSTSVASATEGTPAPSDSWASTSRGVGSSSYACSVVTPVASPWVTGSFGSALADAAPRCMEACASTTH